MQSENKKRVSDSGLSTKKKGAKFKLKFSELLKFAEGMTALSFLSVQWRKVNK